MPIYALGDKQPQIDTTAWVADSAALIGEVQLAAHSNIWFNAVLRADNDVIAIGERSNVQDGAILHTDPGLRLQIGREVVIGHQAMLHGCTVGDNSLIGIQAVVMNGAVIGKNSIVGAGALVTEGKEFPDGVLIMGSPAKVVRELDARALQHLQQAANNYVKKSELYRKKLRRLG